MPDPWPDRILAVDPHRCVGIPMDLDVARRRLGGGLTCTLATHLAYYRPGVVVHFWDDRGRQQFVAHEDPGLVEVTAETFAKRSMPVTHFLPDCLGGDGNRPRFGDAPAPTREWLIRLVSQDLIQPHATVCIRASSPEEAVAIMRRDWEQHEEEVGQEMFETLEMQAQNQCFDLDSITIEEVEPNDD